MRSAGPARRSPRRSSRETTSGPTIVSSSRSSAMVTTARKATRGAIPRALQNSLDGVPPIDLRHQGRRRIGLADQRPLEIGLRDRAKAAEPRQRLPEQLMLLRRSLRPALARPGRDQVAAIDPQRRRPLLVGAVLERVDRLRIAQLPVLAHLVQEQVEGGPVRRILLVRRLETDVGLAQRLGRLWVLDDCIEGAVEVLKHRSSSNVHRQTSPPPAPSGAEARPIAMIANPRGATRWRFVVWLPRRHRASEPYGHRAGWARSESRERSSATRPCAVRWHLRLLRQHLRRSIPSC